MTTLIEGILKNGRNISLKFIIFFVCNIYHDSSFISRL